MQKTILSAKGLFTDPNNLSKVPDGAMTIAKNVVIDRDDIVESRRGFGKYGNTFPLLDDRAKQLLLYKDRILVHYNNKLLFNSNPHNNDVDGLFEEFDGTYNELVNGLRLKYIESNKNLYFTTNDGIKKISASSASDFSTSPDYITDAGGIKALDLTGQLSPSTGGFLAGNSKVAYRLVWGIKDVNNNLILGSPSSRLVITNYSDTNSNVQLTSVIPPTVTENHFYQIYRTSVFTATGNINLDNLNPGDEMQLVFEDFPSSAELSAGSFTVTDIASEDFRQGGTFLYTNPNSGEGIGQANEPPPKAHDLTMYQNTVFYANTVAKSRLEIDLLGVTGMVSGSSQVTITDGTTSNTYTFVGEKEETQFDFTSYTGTIPTDLNGKYFLMNSSSNKRKYYVWYDTTKTTQTLDFTSYIGSIPSDLDGDYVVFYAKDRNYYVWFDSTGSTPDPKTLSVNSAIADFFGIKVDISSGVVTKADVASAIASQLTTDNIYNDYDVVYTASNEFVEIETESLEQSTEIQTIQQGFVYLSNTPLDQDPANTPGVNTDVVGRIPIRVDVARNVTTKAGLADATAAAISDQDNANDFTVDYTASNEFFNVENTNNGNTDDAVDSAIEGLANGFSITVLNQGDGEDSALNHVLLSDAASPSQQIDETARSLVNIINKNSNELVYAFYLSGSNDVPGQILLEARDIGENEFYLNASDTTVGGLFNPEIPLTGNAVAGESETKPNRIFYAKIQQPEAVPLLNFIDVGPEDKRISRILALRESLFILKEDGVYRLTGLNGVFAVDLFDESTKIIAPDTAVVLNNQIYCLTNQGVAVISDTGVSIISKNIDNLVQRSTSSNYNYKYTSFGISYETDRSYILSLPTNTSDTVATQALRYNTYTQTWTQFDISKTCGVVNTFNDKLYLGPADANFIEQERKRYDRTDYADREIETSIPSNSIDGTSIALAQANLAKVGDALVQKQYLTISQYNQLLSKLDLDPFTGEAEDFTVDFSSYTGSIPNDLHGKYFIMYSASDAVKYVVFYDAQGDLASIDTVTNSDARDATQIRIDITGLTTKAEIAQKTQNTIKSTTLAFNITYVTSNEFFTAVTVQNGETTDPSDSTLNPIGNGFSITVNTQGFGDYVSSLKVVAGVNLFNSLDNLAIKLDNDPSIVANDFVTAIDDYSATGATITSGNPTTITEVGHNLQTGRLIRITNSTNDIDGAYTITRVDADNFTINIETTSNGTCDYVANVDDFEELQAAFNTIVNKINVDSGTFYSNYPLSSGFSELEVLVNSITINTANLVAQYAVDFIEGPISLFKGIVTEIQYTPEHFGDTSVSKQVREGTFIFEDANFTRASVGYKTDLSPNLETIDFNKSGKGDWGLFIWGEQNWGGGFSGVPFRTLIPRDKQRCRFIQSYFNHSSAREKYALYGFSYTYRGVSERAYR